MLGQLAVTAKDNEIPALRDLLEAMNITDAVTSADAMHWQQETAAHITDRGEHYVLTIKHNQPTLRAARTTLPWKNVPAVTVTPATAGGSAAHQRPCRSPTGSTSLAPRSSSRSAETEPSRDAR